MLRRILSVTCYLIARIHDPLADTLPHKCVIGTLRNLFPIISTHLFNLFNSILGLGNALLSHPGGAFKEFLPVKAVISGSLLKNLDLESEKLIFILQTSTLLKDLVCEFDRRVYQ